MKILVVDDSPEVTEAVSLCFELRWPHSNVFSALTGSKGIEMVESETPDLLILDIGLPDMDGFEVCRQVRSFSEVPIIMLTVRDRDVDVARGLELGADDYITKPFSHIEFLARVQAVLRRAQTLPSGSGEPPFQSGELWMDFNSRYYNNNDYSSPTTSDGTWLSLNKTSTRTWSADFDDEPAEGLYGGFKVILTFEYPGWGSCVIESFTYKAQPPTLTPSLTKTPTLTRTPTPTKTSTPGPAPSATWTDTPATATEVPSETPSPTDTETPVPTDTEMPAPSPTA